MGTLVLANNNNYTGGTTVSGGVLSISSDRAVGNRAGGLTLSGGTLQATGNINTSRAITLGSGGGTFDETSFSTLSIVGTISGSGASRRPTKAP